MGDPSFTFGEFLKNKRLELNFSLKEVSDVLEISSPFLSDIEKDRRNLSKDKLILICKLYNLSNDESDKLYDLAAIRKGDTISYDLINYVMGNDNLRKALRIARDKNISNEDWSKIIDIINRKWLLRLN